MHIQLIQFGKIIITKKNRLMGASQLLQKQVHGRNPVCFSGLTSNGFTTSPFKVQVLSMAKVLTGGLLLHLAKLSSLRLECQASYYQHTCLHAHTCRYWYKYVLHLDYNYGLRYNITGAIQRQNTIHETNGEILLTYSHCSIKI